MKKVLSILGGIFLLLILVIASLFGYVAYQGRGLDASSKDYVANNVPIILSTWSKDELLKRSSPQLLHVLNGEQGQLDQLFRKFSGLGALLSFGDIKGEANILYSAQYGKKTTASYIADAKFQNGEAKIIVRLILSPEGKWQFLLFRINSPLFIQ